MSLPEEPSGSQADESTLSQLGDVLNAGESDRAGEVLERLGLGELKRLLVLVSREYEPLFARRQVVCIVGPVNSGKSSLYNALITPAGSRARVSAVPGSTRRNQLGEAEAFQVVDTPGANEMAVGGEGPEAGAARHAEAMGAAAAADFLVMVFDASRGIAQDEVRIYSQLARLGKPFVVALNKMDLIGRDRHAVVEAAARNLQLPAEEIIPISALRRRNLNRLLLAIVRTDPKLLTTLAEMAPASRWSLAQNTILSACAAAGTANLMTAPIQIPFSSFVPISAIQVAMVLRLARVFGFQLGPGRAKEIVLTLGSGLLGRTLFYQLANLVPVAGYLLGTAIAAGTTMAVGFSVAAWFAYGERPTSQAVRALSERLTRALIESLKGSRDRRSLQQSIRAAAAAVLGQIAGDAVPKDSSGTGGG